MHRLENHYVSIEESPCSNSLLKQSKNQQLNMQVSGEQLDTANENTEKLVSGSLKPTGNSLSNNKKNIEEESPESIEDEFDDDEIPPNQLSRYNIGLKFFFKPS